MSDYVCETCSEDVRYFFASLDRVVSACEEHRRPVVQRRSNWRLSHLTSHRA